MTESPKKRIVLFDHDGGVDDLLSLMMVLAMPHIELVGVVVTPADCFLGPAMSSSLKILRFFDRLDIPVSQGVLHGVNPFPQPWRSQPYPIDALPILNENEEPLPSPAAAPGHEFIARKLREATEPLTVLITGPVSNLALALTQEPDLAAKIEEVVWMGGALQVKGNVRDFEHDGSAEWNAYWDPPATYSLWQSPAPITLFPLDATNHVPVTRDFLQRLARQRRCPLSDLAGQCWALTLGTIPSYEYVYHMWDTLTTGYLGGPQFITFREAQTEVVAAGPSAGQIKEVETGRPVRAADRVEVEGFLDYVLELLRR
ncbi:MAG: nucleoside hydrolase [Anaerolineales bacterium]|nr:nucleoside hydrolase [Anaerolineales bacterium]